MAEYILGIDTSNYTTSVAITDKNGNVISDQRKLLEVKKGERGLRQQEALFQHVSNLPGLIENAFEEVSKESIKGIAVSTRPRPVQGSYMPCFNAGVSMAKSIASVLKVPVVEVSHQEGHIEAAGGIVEDEGYAFHLSGGTCELLKIETRYDDNALFDGYDIEIVGGSKDISFGQLIDRLGVAMGMDFPCGAQLDQLAAKMAETGDFKPSRKVFSKAKAKNRWVNLSGHENQGMKAIEEKINHMVIAAELLGFVAETIGTITSDLDVTLVGGVSESQFIRSYFKENKNFRFANTGMGKDNAVGVSILGGRILWQNR